MAVSVAAHRRSLCGSVRGWPLLSSHFSPGAAPQVGHLTVSIRSKFGFVFMARGSYTKPPRQEWSILLTPRTASEGPFPPDAVTTICTDNGLEPHPTPHPNLGQPSLREAVFLHCKEFVIVFVRSHRGGSTPQLEVDIKKTSKGTNQMSPSQLRAPPPGMAGDVRPFDPRFHQRDGGISRAHTAAVA
jgi:hypothetical protein